MDIVKAAEAYRISLATEIKSATFLLHDMSSICIEYTYDELLKFEAFILDALREYGTCKSSKALGPYYICLRYDLERTRPKHKLVDRYFQMLKTFVDGNKYNLSIDKLFEIMDTKVHRRDCLHCCRPKCFWNSHCTCGEPFH